MKATETQRELEKRPKFIDYAKFMDALEERALYETMYEDSEGRMILVINPLNLYSFVCRMWEENL